MWSYKTGGTGASAGAEVAADVATAITKTTAVAAQMGGCGAIKTGTGCRGLVRPYIEIDEILAL